MAQHSIFPQFAAKRPDAADAARLAALCSAGARGTGRRRSATARFAGNRPYRPLGVMDLKPRAGAGCTACGLCASRCPVGAISLQAPAQTDASLCIGCMRCAAVCPAHARHVDAAALAGAQQRLQKACEARKPNELFL